MNSQRYLLLILVATVLAACSDAPETTPPTVPEPPATEAPAPASQPLEAEETGTAEQATVEIVEESAGEDTEEDLAIEGETILSQLTDAGADSVTEQSPQWRYDPSTHFTILTTAQGTSSSPDTIEVAEVFWYGCPHCFTFDPYLDRWQTELADDVSFVRIPVMWNPTNQVHARIFYTAEALGKLDEMHEAIFREIHLNQKTLTTEAEIRAFFERFGVSDADFQSTFRSFSVESKLKRAQNLTSRYQIRSVPLLVVNGKFVINGPDVKSFDDMIAVADELVERERLRL